jgi:acylphosphatase
VSPSTDRERRTARFRGRVQGVGFRYQTQRVARNFEVLGYVKNLPSGEVELVVEGMPDELDRFLADVRQVMNRFIHEVHTDNGPSTGEFSTFEIRI